MGTITCIKTDAQLIIVVSDFGSIDLNYDLGEWVHFG